MVDGSGEVFPRAGRDAVPAACPDAIRIGVAGGESLFRVGLRALLTAEMRGVEVVPEFPGEAWESVPPSDGRCHVLLLGIDPLETDEVARVFAGSLGVAGRRRTRVLLFGSLRAERKIIAGMLSGADGFVPTSALPDELFSAIRAVHRGKCVIHQAALRGLVSQIVRGGETECDAPPSSKVPPIQEELLALLSKGLTNFAIAKELGISVTAVKARVSRLLRTLGAGNRVQAALLGARMRDAALESGDPVGRGG